MILLAASTSVASAGGYLGLGIGTPPAVSSDANGKHFSDSRSGRLLGGMRFGHLAVEGSLGRFDLVHRGLESTSTTLGLGAKYSLPLGSNFEVFGRGGVQRMWLTTNTYPFDAVGNGPYLGGGFEYRFNVVATSASAFVDYQWAKSSVTNDHMLTYDQSARMWTLGFTVGL